MRLNMLARRQPPRQMLMLLLAVGAVIAAILAYEAVFGWPESLTPERQMRPPAFPQG